MHRNTIIAGVAVIAVLVAGLAAWQFGPWSENATDTAATDGAAVAESSADAAADAASSETTQAADSATADAGAQAVPLFDDDHILGNADAPITMIEYASLTCPHCAKFHNEILPEIKKNYIETGLVRLVYRDYPLDKVALHASLIADCAPEENYFRILGVMFSTQEQWAASADPAAALEQIGRTGGIAPDAMAACTSDEATAQKILARAQEGQDVHGIRSTPSFIINGKLVSGAQPYEEFDKILQDLLPDS